MLKRGLRSCDTYVNGTPEAPYDVEPGTLPRRRHKEAVVEIIRERHDAEGTLHDAREALDRLSRTLAG